MAKKKTAAKEFVPAAVLTLEGWPTMHTQQREAVKIWLRDQLHRLERSEIGRDDNELGEAIADRYRARQLFPVPDAVKAAKRQRRRAS